MQVQRQLNRVLSTISNTVVALLVESTIMTTYAVTITELSPPRFHKHAYMRCTKFDGS